MDKLRWYLSKYNKNSLWTFIFVVISCASVAYYWRNIISDGDLDDPLLWGIWAFMTMILCWNINAKRDLLRMFVGLLGGLTIEAWGTQTNLWVYYTNERPPLWIIPAWPVATIAIDRISRMYDYFFASFKLEWLWWLLVIVFPMLMLEFIWPAIQHWSTVVVFIAVLIILGISKDRRQDVSLMLAGASLGVFLEYWGTSRNCWTYYTYEIPPIFAIFAHGMASISFQRAAYYCAFFWRKITRY